MENRLRERTGLYALGFNPESFKGLMLPFIIVFVVGGIGVFFVTDGFGGFFTNIFNRIFG